VTGLHHIERRLQRPTLVFGSGLPEPRRVPFRVAPLI